jgi:glycosyltransferase involved in cell wall biosynthesis
VGGLPELIEDQHTGYLIPYREENLFLDKLGELIGNIKIRQDLGTAARRRSVSFAGWEQSAERLIHFIQDSINL